MISMSVGFHPAVSPAPGLVLTGLRDGRAVVGDTLGARLSDGTVPDSFAWGSSPGAADYGSGAELEVPSAAENGLLHLSAEQGAAIFTTSVAVLKMSSLTTVVTADPDEITIETLAPLTTLPGLSLTPAVNNITVETV